MADSNITKKALAEALKELMNEYPFSKISVADICGRCDMNRKSFYYHFKDKYDLVNWIFDVEFFKVIEQTEDNHGWGFMEKLCVYFYENKKFYRCALQIKGQNSFEEHFIEQLTPIIEETARKTLQEKNEQIDENVLEFNKNFCIDAFVAAIKRWIMDKREIEPDEFLRLAKTCVELIGNRIEEYR